MKRTILFHNKERTIFRRFRKAAALSQIEFGEKLGCGQTSVSLYENRLHVPPVKMMRAFIKLCNEYGYYVPLEELFKDYATSNGSDEQNKFLSLPQNKTPQVINTFLTKA